MRYFLVILTLICFLFLIGYSQKLSTEVYEGTGYCSGTNIPDVEKCAVEEAKRDALNKAGTYLRATSRVDMFQLTESEINSFASGFVRVLERQIKTEYDSVMHAVKATAMIKAEINNEQIQNGISSIIRSDSTLENRQKPLKFEFALYGRKPLADGQYTQVLVNENSGLNSGNQFQISFKSNQDCYVYVINIDSQGNIFPAFPNKEKGIVDNHLRADEEYILPAAGLYYELDTIPGMETIYFVGSFEPMKDINFILDNLENLGRNSTALRGLLEARSGARGIAKIVEGTSGGNLAQEARKILQGTGSLVLKTNFNHY